MKDYSILVHNILNMFINFLYLLFLFGLVICIAEFANNFTHFSPFIVRKIAHIFCGLVFASIPIYLNEVYALLICIVLVFIVIASWYIRIFNKLENTHKHNYGTIFFPLGFILPIILFWKINPYIISVSALILGFSDALAALIGKRFGKLKYKFIETKTVEGSITFFILSLVIFIISFSIFSKLFIDISIIRILIFSIGALILSIIEGLSAKGTDNFFIPLASSITIYIAMYIVI